MNDTGIDCQDISRRMVFTGMALAIRTAAAAAAISRASAQEQITQAAVSSRPTPKGDQRCGVAVTSSNRTRTCSSETISARMLGASYLPRRADAKRSPSKCCKRRRFATSVRSPCGCAAAIHSAFPRRTWRRLS